MSDNLVDIKINMYCKPLYNIQGTLTREYYHWLIAMGMYNTLNIILTEKMEESNVR